MKRDRRIRSKQCRSIGAVILCLAMVITAMPATVRAGIGLPFIPADPSKRIEGVDYSFSTSKKTATITNCVKGMAGELEIPSTVSYEGEDYTVTDIKSVGFNDCKLLTSIKLPATITKIGNAVFNGCSSLEEIAIDDENAKYTVESKCLIDKTTDTIIAAINGAVVPENVKKIGEEAFSGCDQLTEIVIPKGIVNVGRMVFAECASLSAIRVDQDNETYYSKGNCLIEKGSNQLIAGCKDSVIPDTVTEIAINGFYACEGLKKITIPGSVKTIGEVAFGSCKELTDVVVEEGTETIGLDAFNNCTSLTNVSLPSSLKHMEEEVFSYCSALQEIVIPENMWSMEQKIFYGCTKLESIYCIDGAGVGLRRMKQDYPTKVKALYQVSFAGIPTGYSVLPYENSRTASGGALVTDPDGKCRFTLRSEPGYKKDIIVKDENGQEITAQDGIYTIDAITENVVLYLNLEGSGVQEYTITASAGEHGSISPSGAVIVNSGSEQRFTITPDEGYEVDTIEVDGNSERSAEEYLFENVVDNHVIHVTFRQKKSEPESSEAPQPSESAKAPESSEIPLPSESAKAPESSEIPLPSESAKAPESSEAPQPSESAKAPESSEAPQPSESAKVPESSEAPLPSESAKVPESSEAPLPSESAKVPESSEAPLPSESAKVPESSEAPLPSESAKVPESSEAPLPSESAKAPESSEAPLPSESAKAPESSQAPSSDQSAKAKKPGTILRDSSGAQYKVITSGKKPQVQYTSAAAGAKGSVKIPATIRLDGVTYQVVSVAKGAFKNNDKLTAVTIGDNVEIIEKNSFSKCKRIKRIIIGKKVRKIGKNAFSGCKGLKEIIVKTTKLTSRGVANGAFKEVGKKVVVKVPKKKLKAYTKLFRAKGLNKKIKLKKA